MTSRSPGPWYVAPDKRKGVSGLPVTVVVDVDGLPVANCGTGSSGVANAALVAHAPSLLRVVLAAYLDSFDVPLTERAGWVADAEDVLRSLGELS